MNEKELNTWFSCLTVKQKEHIAAKVLLKKGLDVKGSLYPNCTPVWLALSVERKQWIHDHCTDDHGVFVNDYNEETSMGHDF